MWGDRNGGKEPGAHSVSKSDRRRNRIARRNRTKETAPALGTLNGKLNGDPTEMGITGFLQHQNPTVFRGILVVSILRIFYYYLPSNYNQFVSSSNVTT